MTNQEINEAVARVLNGWGPEWTHIKPIDYCTDLVAAWEIVGHLLKEGVFIEIQCNPWTDKVGDGKIFYFVNLDEYQTHETAESLPKALCLAFLKIQSQEKS